MLKSARLERLPVPLAESGDWRVPEGMPADAGFAAYRRETERADAITTATSLATAPAWWLVELFGEWRLESVREIVLHTMKETAGHTGHLDGARELIDGRLQFVLDA